MTSTSTSTESKRNITHDESFALLEEVLNKFLPVDGISNNVQIRRVIRAAALVCAWPDSYTVSEAREKMEIDR